MRRDDGSAKVDERVLAILRRVRGRWRLRIALKGLAVVLGAGALAFLASAWALEWSRFSPAAVTGFRVAAWGVVALLAVLFLARPLFRRVSDERVALYLEEHEPSLEAAILAAVEVGRRGQAGPSPSPELARRLVRSAVERARAVDEGRRIDQRGLRRSTGALAAVTVASVGALVFLPPDVRHGLSALLVPTTDAASVNPYSISVDPGDVTVARGSDQLVEATLAGFESDDVSLLVTDVETDRTRRFSMLPRDDGGFDLLLLDLQGAARYAVESDGVRSATYTIEVADLPYVSRLEQVLRFPSYTGLPPRTVEDGGDVAALPGTRVDLTVHPTLPTTSGRVVMGDGSSSPLVPAGDGTLTGRFTVEEPGFYRIELEASDGTPVEASPQYTIDVLEDQPPTISVAKPGRDTQASPIEEVYVEVEVLDDYAVESVSLAYSVNGEARDAVRLWTAGGSPLAEVSSGHTLYLEEYGLEPGDVVSYWAVGRDADGRGGGREVTSDIYFLQIRPFGRDYREADQQGGGQGQGAGGGGAETALSELQRQVIAATFNLDRDRDRYSGQDFSENVVSVKLAQGRVKEQVNTLVERMVNRGLSSAEEQFQRIAEMLPGAVEEMERAEAALDDEDLDAALPHEQRALQALLKAEETYERYVTLQQQQGGGGGGGQTPDAEDLADLFELELDKLRNQYETVERGERRQADDQADELLEQLKELARRQQQEAERQRRAAAQQGGGSGGGGDSQRQLAEQTEELARRLERLARQSRDRDLEEVARDLRETADAMRRSAAADRGTRSSGAGAAADRLDDARRRLERERARRLRRDADDAVERVRRLAEQQAEVRRDLRDMPDDRARRDEAIRRLHQRKDAMGAEVRDLERQLDDMAADALREGRREAARELGEAAGSIRENQLEEKLAWSKGVVEERAEEEFATRFEAEIALDIADLEREVREASEALGTGEADPLEEALDRARDLSRGTESLRRRLERGDRQPGAEAGAGEPGDGRREDGERPGTGEEAPDGAAGEPTGEPGEGAEGERREGSEGRPGEPAEAGGAEAGGGGAPGTGTAGRPGDPDAPPAGGATRGDPGRLSDEEVRQFRREFRERAGEARELRRALEAAGRETGDLTSVIRAMEALQDEEAYGDLPELARLQEEIREGLQRLEFRLRREVEGEERGPGVRAGSDDVPEEFRSLVEEYFRALARERGGPGGG